jgi:hypothetical protein
LCFSAGYEESKELVAEWLSTAGWQGSGINVASKAHSESNSYDDAEECIQNSEQHRECQVYSVEPRASYRDYEFKLGFERKIKFLLLDGAK